MAEDLYSRVTRLEQAQLGLCATLGEMKGQVHKLMQMLEELMIAKTAKEETSELSRGEKRSRGLILSPRPQTSSKHEGHPSTLMPSLQQTHQGVSRGVMLEPTRQGSLISSNTKKELHHKEERKGRRVDFDPIPMTYDQLYPQLLKAHMVSPVLMEQRKPPYPAWYRSEARCVYHNNGPGHDINDCFAFKKKVQSLKDAGMLDLSTGTNFHNDHPWKQLGAT